MAVDARRLKTVETVFGIDAAGVLLADILPPWMLDLNLLVETGRSRPARRERPRTGSRAW